MGGFIDETGNRYERLVVLERGPADNSGEACWLCQCDCGETTVTRGSALRTGHTRSCGCLHKEMLENGLVVRHGMNRRAGKHPVYKLWENIKSRCYNPNAKGYKDYGGRGIMVYEPWRNDPQAFVEWIEVNLGPRPEGYSLDRIDNNGDYVPGNLRWADRKTQVSNRREVVYKEPLEEVLTKIATSIEFYSSQSRLAEKSDDLYLKHCYNGIKAGLETAEKWIRDAIKEDG